MPTRAPGTAQPSLGIDNVSLAHLATILPRRMRQSLNSSNTSTAIVELQKRRTKRSQSKGRPSIIDSRRSSRQSHKFVLSSASQSAIRDTGAPCGNLISRKSCLTIIEKQGSPPEFRPAVGRWLRWGRFCCRETSKAGGIIERATERSRDGKTTYLEYR
jgi:hypothetical protein